MNKDHRGADQAFGDTVEPGKEGAKLDKFEAAPIKPMEERGLCEFTPLGESSAIKLSVPIIKRLISAGDNVTPEDCTKFLMLCRSRLLNPFTGDAYLVKYGPNAQLIVSYQALLKRAEASGQFDGLQSGIIIAVRDDNEVIVDKMHRPGITTLPGETVIGGWASVHRKDMSYASDSEAILSTYNTGKRWWAKDPNLMIVKVAKAAALREAFPSECGGLYTSDEMEQTK